MRKRTGYLIQGALPTIAALGLLLLASSGPAFAGFKEHNFHGRYVASYHAFDSSITGTVNEPNPPAIPYAVSGAMFSDGKGNVSGFLNEDYGSPGTGAAATCSISGTYTVGTAPLGPMGGFVTINMTSSLQDCDLQRDHHAELRSFGFCQPGIACPVVLRVVGPVG